MNVCPRVPFPTEAAARAAPRSHGRTSPYWCPFCEAWHAVRRTPWRPCRDCGLDIVVMDPGVPPVDRTGTIHRESYCRARVSEQAAS